MLHAPGHARIVYALAREGWCASVCPVSCMLLNLCNSCALTRTFWAKPTLRIVRRTSGSRTVIRKSTAHAIRCDDRDTTLRGRTRSCSCSLEVTVAEVLDHYRFTKLDHVEGNDPEGVRIKRVMSESVGVSTMSLTSCVGTCHFWISMTVSVPVSFRLCHPNNIHGSFPRIPSRTRAR